MKKRAAPIDYSLYAGRWIALVLVNLISNAVKFTRLRQPAEIEIGCAPGEEAETVVFVRDVLLFITADHSRRLMMSTLGGPTMAGKVSKCEFVLLSHLV